MHFRNLINAFCIDCYISVTDKQVSPKSGTLKSPPKGFDTSAISKTYYNLVRTHSSPAPTCVTQLWSRATVSLFDPGVTEHLGDRDGIFQGSSDPADKLPATSSER